MNLPDPIRAVVTAAVAKYPDVGKAVSEAVKAVRKLPDFETFVDALVHNAVMEAVYDARHSANTMAKQASGQYGQPGGLRSAESLAVQTAAEAGYRYYIAGKTLGSVFGKDLPDIAAGEEGRANGHHFNARLCRALARIVPKEEQVQQAVSETRLKTIFRRVQNGKEAA